MPEGVPPLPGDFQMPNFNSSGNAEMSEEMKRILKNPEYKEVLESMAKMENMPQMESQGKTL